MEFDAEDLLRGALSRPRETAARATTLLATSLGPEVKAVAHQALGIVLRDTGDAAALGHLRSAVHLSRRSRDDQGVADVLATYGAALVMFGETRRGFAQLEEASRLATGETLARVRMRRAYLLRLVGEASSALQEINRALVGIRRARDVVWEARALNSRALIHLSMGHTVAAERDIDTSYSLFTESGQELEAAFCVHNLGLISYSRNDIPKALRFYDRAAKQYAALDAPSPDLAIDRSTALMTAGLADECVDTLLESLGETNVQPIKRAELELALALALLAAGRPVEAITHGGTAASTFASQVRPYWHARARLATLQAQFSADQSGEHLHGAAAACAHELEAFHDESATAAHLLAGRFALQAHLTDAAHDHLSAAGKQRTKGTALNRVDAWLAQALLNAAEGNQRMALAACARGLDELRDLCAAFGSMELRALATSHGVELASMAMRHSVQSRDARMLLRWSERWRAAALTLPRPAPDVHGQNATDLAALRDSIRRLGEVRASGGSTVHIDRERAELEEAIRRREHQVRGEGSGGSRFRLDDLIAELGETTFVELVELDSHLHAITVSSGVVRKHLVGPSKIAHQRVGHALFTLHGKARGVPIPLGAVGQAMQDAVLGGAVHLLGSGPVVISPPTRLQNAPWTLMPALANRPVSVTPSAALWMRARNRTPPGDARVVLVAGPHLHQAEAEIARLREHYPAAKMLVGEDAGVGQVLAHMDGAWLVHLAAHGHFRPDNPLFSSLDLADGPLTVYDLHGIAKAPHTLVLSACDSGVSAPTGAEELLGLTTALIGLGTASVISSVSEVSDTATAKFMLEVHRHVSRGSSFPEAMALARNISDTTELEGATAASFTSFGV